MLLCAYTCHVMSCHVIKRLHCLVYLVFPYKSAINHIPFHAAICLSFVTGTLCLYPIFLAFILFYVCNARTD